MISKKRVRFASVCLVIFGVLLLVCASGVLAAGPTPTKVLPTKVVPTKVPPTPTVAPTNTPTPTSDPAAKKPNIVKFYAAPASVKAGETTTLYWKVTGASECEIVGIEKTPEENLPIEGSLEVWPMTTTSYVLIVYGLDGTIISQSVTVNVDASGAVKIQSFKASATQVAPYETVMLTWVVLNGKSVRVVGISPKGDEVICPIVGGIEVWPETTTTYLLEATGLNGEIASASITVNVKAPTLPKILSFTASKSVITRGELVKLSWTTQDAVKCTITTSDGATLPNRPPNGSISVTPNTTKTYTLTAINANGNEVKASLVITVQ